MTRPCKISRRWTLWTGRWHVEVGWCLEPTPCFVWMTGDDCLIWIPHGCLSILIFRYMYPVDIQGRPTVPSPQHWYRCPFQCFCWQARPLRCTSLLSTSISANQKPYIVFITTPQELCLPNHGWAKTCGCKLLLLSRHLLGTLQGTPPGCQRLCL